MSIATAADISAAKAARRRRRGELGLHAPNEDETMDGAGEHPSEPEDDEEGEEGGHRSRRKRRRELTAPVEEPRADAGEKDHLFFSLMAPPAEDASGPPTVLCATYGSECVRHPAGSSAADAIHAESHLLELTMRSLAYSAADGEDDDGAAARSPTVVRLDRHDVRLLVDQAEWMPPRRSDDDDDDDEDPWEEREEWIDTTTPEESGAAADDEQPTPDDLLREKVTPVEWVQLQRERYQDLDSRADATEAEADTRMADASSPPSSSESDAPPPGEERDDASLELDADTIADELATRRRMEARGSSFHFRYDDHPPKSTTLPPTAVAAAAAPTPTPPLAGVTGKRPPPPPPRKQPAPPPPRPAAAAPAKPPSDASAASEARPSPPPPAPAVEPPFKPSFVLPEDVRPPRTLAEHRVIAHTVKYLESLGGQAGQQEILLKLKQRANEKFYFMNWDHPLHAYYTFMKQHPQHAHARETDTAGPLPIPAGQSETKSAQPPGGHGEAAAPPTAAATSSAAPIPPANLAPPPGVKPPPGVARKPPAATPLAPPSTPPIATEGVMAHSADAVPSPSPPSSLEAPADLPASNALAGLLGGYGDDDEDEEVATAPTPSAVAPALVPPAASVIPLSASLLALLPSPPVPLPPADVLAVIHATCSQAHRKGSAFATLLRAKERNNPKYAFLQPASEHHAYFAWLTSVQAIVEVEQRNASESATAPPTK